MSELTDVSKKYSGDRKSQILYDVDEYNADEEQSIEDYPVTLFITKEGYLNKIKSANLRMSGEQKVKEGDEVERTFECSNKDEILAFRDNFIVFKKKLMFIRLRLTILTIQRRHSSAHLLRQSLKWSRMKRLFIFALSANIRAI